MQQHHTSYLGIGLYDFAQVDRLIEAKGGSTSRWVLGYERRLRGVTKQHLPVVKVDHRDLAEQGIVTFREFVELKLIATFRKYRVSMRTIREAAAILAKQYQTDHPLALRDIHTDGKRLFIKANTIWGEDQQLIMELPELQSAMGFVQDFFVPNLEYGDDGYSARYWPLGKDAGVVLDPQRHFGHPILDQSRVPTEAIYGPYAAGDSVEMIAHWFEVTPEAVRAAIRFEEQLRHRKLAA